MAARASPPWRRPGRVRCTRSSTAATFSTASTTGSWCASWTGCRNRSCAPSKRRSPTRRSRGRPRAPAALPAGSRGCKPATCRRTRSTSSSGWRSRSGGLRRMLEPATPALLVAIPLLGVLAVSVTPAARRASARLWTMGAMLAVLALSLRILISFDETQGLDFDLPWMPALGIHLHLGLDVFNLDLVALAWLLFPVVLASTWNAAYGGRRLYLALLLVLQSSLLGTFLSQNLVLFFVFWEAVLIPAGVLILVFGGAERRRAAMAFFLYTLAGSVLLLAAVIALGVQSLQQTGRWSFELAVLYEI